MSSCSTWPSSWATTESQLRAIGLAQQVVVEDDPLASSRSRRRRRSASAPGGWRRPGTPRRCRPRPARRAQHLGARPAARRAAASNWLKSGASTTGASQTKTTASATDGAAPGQPPAAPKRRTSAISSAAPAGGQHAPIAADFASVRTARSRATGSRSRVDRALVGGDARRQRRATPGQHATARRRPPPPRAPGAPPSRSRPLRTGAGRPSASVDEHARPRAPAAPMQQPALAVAVSRRPRSIWAGVK